MVAEEENSSAIMKPIKTLLLPFVFALLAPISFAAQFEDEDDFYEDLEMPELNFRIFGDLGASYENPDSLRDSTCSASMNQPRRSGHMSTASKGVTTSVRWTRQQCVNT